MVSKSKEMQNLRDLYKIHALMNTFQPNMMAVDGSRYDRWKIANDLLEVIINRIEKENEVDN